MGLSASRVDDVTTGIDVSMRQLRGAMSKIPKKDLGFRAGYEKAAASVAVFMMLLDEAQRTSQNDDSIWL